jgi:hypothetical protein
MFFVNITQLFYTQILLRNTMNVMHMKDYPTLHLEMKYMSITVIVVLHFTVTVFNNENNPYICFISRGLGWGDKVTSRYIWNTDKIGFKHQSINQHYTIINQAKKQFILTRYTPSFSSRTRTSQHGCHCYISLLCSHYDFFQTIFILSAGVSNGKDCWTISW